MPVAYGSVAGVNKPVSRLVLGTMIINTPEQEKSSALLDAALEHGINTLDSALVYGGGDSERAIGAWMQQRGNRESVVVLTKGAHPNADRKRVTRFDIASDLHDSLARLKTNYIDIYMLHRDDPDVPAGDVVEWLNEFHSEGKFRAFGGSNWTHSRIREANEYAEKHGLVPFAASSPHFSLAEQVDNPWGQGCVTLTGNYDPGARGWYRKANMPVFAYSSLARGLFSGRITREDFIQTADGACRAAYCHECNFQRLDRAGQLAAEKGVTVAQIALAYVINYPLNLYALIGAASREEIRACADATAIKLTPAEMAWLNLERADR